MYELGEKGGREGDTKLIHLCYTSAAVHYPDKESKFNVTEKTTPAIKNTAKRLTRNIPAAKHVTYT